MTNTLTKLRTLEKSEAEESKTIKPFKKFQEEAIVSLALDHPEFFLTVVQYLKPEMFARLETRWVIAELLNLNEKFNIVPTRAILRDHLEGKVTEDEPYEEIFKIVDRRSDYREVPIIKEVLLEWARKKAFGMLYKPEAIAAFKQGNYEYIETLFNEASKIVDVGDNNGFWFFENLEILFQPDLIEHRTTGFARLDKILNNGGPSAKEVVCWLAPTNVGKCHSSQTLIIEERLSRIYKLELEDGSILNLRGSREIQTARGIIKVADLTDEDDIIGEIPPGDDTWDLELPTV